MLLPGHLAGGPECLPVGSQEECDFPQFTSEMSCDECPPAHRAPASSCARTHLPCGQRARAVCSHCPEPLSRAFL